MPQALRFLPLLLLLLAAACSRVPQPQPVTPDDYLLRIVAEFQRFAAVDVYRLGMPRDAANRNAFHAAVERLDAYEAELPNKNTDIVCFTRAESLLRLGAYAKARDNFARSADAATSSPLATKACERIVRCEQFLDALRPDEQPAERVKDQLTQLESRRDRFVALEEKLTATPDAPVVKRAHEQAGMQITHFLFEQRMVLEHGTRRALDAANDLIRAHENSNRVFAHRLMLGTFYFDLARTMEISTPADGAGFDLTGCLDLSAKAREQLTLVSRADGYEEKLEGIARLQDLDAFMRRMRRFAE